MQVIDQVADTMLEVADKGLEYPVNCPIMTFGPGSDVARKYVEAILKAATPKIIREAACVMKHDLRRAGEERIDAMREEARRIKEISSEGESG